jgi:hypothetical protein
MTQETYVTRTQAARILGVPFIVIERLCYLGELQEHHHHHCIHLNLSDVLAYRRKLGPFRRMWRN